MIRWLIFGLAGLVVVPMLLAAVKVFLEAWLDRREWRKVQEKYDVHRDWS